MARPEVSWWFRALLDSSHLLTLTLRLLISRL